MLQQLAEALWVEDHDFSLMGANIGTRTSIVRLSDGSLFLHAPGPLSPEMADEIDGLGEVRFLVAPNCFHHLYLADHAARWPGAQLYAAPGLSDKRKDLNFSGVLADQPDSAWAEDLDQIWIGGAPRVNEIAFLHRSSRSLLLVDLVFNVTPANFFMKIMMRINGSRGLGTSRLMRFMLKDLSATRVSVQRIFEWDFDRVIMSHGEVVEANGRSALLESFGWLLNS